MLKIFHVLLSCSHQSPRRHMCIPLDRRLQHFQELPRSIKIRRDELASFSRRSSFWCPSWVVMIVAVRSLCNAAMRLFSSFAMSRYTFFNFGFSLGRSNNPSSLLLPSHLISLMFSLQTFSLLLEYFLSLIHFAHTPAVQSDLFYLLHPSKLGDIGMRIGRRPFPTTPLGIFIWEDWTKEPIDGVILFHGVHTIQSIQRD